MRNDHRRTSRMPIVLKVEHLSKEKYEELSHQLNAIYSGRGRQSIVLPAPDIDYKIISPKSQQMKNKRSRLTASI